MYVRMYVRTYVHTYAYTVATYIRMHMAVGNMPKMRVDPSEMNGNIGLVMTMMQDKACTPSWSVWRRRLGSSHRLEVAESGSAIRKALERTTEGSTYVFQYTERQRA